MKNLDETETAICAPYLVLCFRGQTLQSLFEMYSELVCFPVYFSSSVLLFGASTRLFFVSVPFPGSFFNMFELGRLSSIRLADLTVIIHT